MSRRDVERWVRGGLLLAASLLLLTRLGATDLWAPDEPRYAQIAEELRSFEHGVTGFALLHLGGEAYTQKPPLYFWMAALFGVPRGHVTETAARLPSALAGIALVFLTLQLGAQLFAHGLGAIRAGESRSPSRTASGFRVGAWAATILLTVPRFAHLGRRVQLDVVLALLETFALFAFWRIESGVGRRRVNLALLHAAIGLAVLTKGPVGLLPIGVIAVYLGWDGRLRELPRLFPGWAWLLSLGPCLAWFVTATSLAPVGFLDQALLDNLVGRFFSGTSHARPFYYYAYQLPLDFLPWTFLWPVVALACARRLGARAAPVRSASARPWRFLIAWLGVFVVFFSLSSGKRGLYLLPVFPGVAILCGAALEDWFERHPARSSGLTVTFAGLVALLTLGGAALWLGAADGFQASAGFAPPRSFAGLLIAIAGLALAAWILLARRVASARRAMACIAGTVFAVDLALFSLLLPHYDGEKSPRPIAEAAVALAAPGEPVAVFRHSALLGGIAYYGGHPTLALEGAEDVRDFLADGGRVMIAREQQLESLRELAPVVVRASLRSGRRAMVVVIAEPRALDQRLDGSRPDLR